MIQATELRTFGIPTGMAGFGLGSDLSQGSATAAGLLTSIAPFTGPAAPFVAAAAGAAQLVSAVAAMFQGCGPTCTETTAIVNQAEPYFQLNVQNYLNNPNRTTCDQQIALQAFDQMWAVIEQNCGKPILAAAGQRCISDRQRGACIWHSASGQCFNWFNGYRDPIANDVPPGGSVSCSTASVESSLGLSGMSQGTIAVLVAAAILAAVVLL